MLALLKLYSDSLQVGESRIPGRFNVGHSYDLRERTQRHKIMSVSEGAGDEFRIPGRLDTTKPPRGRIMSSLQAQFAHNC